MDSSVKQFIAIVIAVLVGSMLIAFVNSDSFKGKIEQAIESQIESLISD